MRQYCIAALTEQKVDGSLTRLQVFHTTNEFLAEHANCAEEKDIDLITLSVEGSRVGELGMFIIPTQPDRRIFYMLGYDSRDTQDALRRAVFDRKEHLAFVETL